MKPEKYEKIDEMVRDFTSVVPRSKSEVHRRINDALLAAYEQGVKDGKDGMDDTKPVTDTKIPTDKDNHWWPRRGPSHA